MNINATGNAAGTGGTGASDTGFNAIHAAIAAVASSNAGVAGIADMNGQFSSSIHYSTASEIGNVATTAYNAINTAFYVLRATVTLTDASGNALANLSGLKWAFFDQATPDVLAAPVNKGATATTSSAGAFSVPVPNTALTAGGIGWLTITNSDGTTTQNPPAKAFSGSVVVG